MTPRRLVALGLLVLGAARTGGAQRADELRVEAGAAVVSQRGIDAANAALLGFLWRRPTPSNRTLIASGNLTYASDSLAAAQAVLVGDLPWRVSERLRTEVGGALASFSIRQSGRGGNGNVFARQHLVGNDRGAFVGLGAGFTGRDGVASSGTSLDAGVWRRYGMLYLSAGLVHFSTDDLALLRASGIVPPIEAERAQMLDRLLTLQVRNGPHDFTLNYIARDGLGGTSAERRTITASGTLQLTERVALLGSGGRQLADPLRGLPEADVLTLSVRVSFGEKPLPVMQRSAIAEANVTAMPGGGGELVVRVLAVESMPVEIAGDFSDWQPLPLTREGTLFWVARVRLGSGKHRVAVRVADGPWRAPRNLARVRDDYGGESGLVVIP